MKKITEKQLQDLGFERDGWRGDTESRFVDYTKHLDDNFNINICFSYNGKNGDTLTSITTELVYSSGTALDLNIDNYGELVVFLSFFFEIEKEKTYNKYSSYRQLLYIAEKNELDVELIMKQK